jgi:CheY-like chemotaxis protein
LRAAGVAVSVEVEPRLPALVADPDQLTQVFTNLFVNAQHALEGVPEPRRLTVTARLDAGAGVVRIGVRDNGPGIPEAIRSRIFEPFFTTKAVGEGTGIGLSVSHSIIQAHGGTIAVDGTGGSGTLFEVTLPIVASRATEESETAVAALTVDGARILVVDDEPEVAQMLADILSDGGNGVETAASGRIALKRLRERDFDLILSDLRMPDLDGPGLYAALESLEPRLRKRVIFVTGDTLSEGAKRFLSESCRPVIEKPFVPDEVRRVVTQALASAERPGG